MMRTTWHRLSAAAALIVLLALFTAPTSAQQLTQEQDPAAACEADLGTTGQSGADQLYRAIEDVARSSGGVFTAIEAQTDFATGWTESGDVAAAIDELRDDIASLKGAVRSVLEGRGWTLDEAADDWRAPAEDVPINPSLATVSNEIWFLDTAFEQNFSDLAELTDRDSVIEFWTQGASPCGTAGTLVDLAADIDPAALAPTQDLAATGSEPARLVGIALVLVAAGLLTLLAGRQVRPEVSEGRDPRWPGP